MKKMTSQLGLALAVFTLAGCGLKGPLYFPEDQAAKPQTTSSVQAGNDTPAPATTEQDTQPAQ